MKRIGEVYNWVRYAFTTLGPSAYGRDYDTWKGLLGLDLLLFLSLVTADLWLQMLTGASGLLQWKQGGGVLLAVIFVTILNHLLSPGTRDWDRKFKAMRTLPKELRMHQIMVAWTMIASVVGFTILSFYLYSQWALSMRAGGVQPR